MIVFFGTNSVVMTSGSELKIGRAQPRAGDTRWTLLQLSVSPQLSRAIVALIQRRSFLAPRLIPAIVSLTPYVSMLTTESAEHCRRTDREFYYVNVKQQSLMSLS